MDPQADSSRSRFLLALLEDEERGGALALEEYLARFPEIASFVREEYAVMLDRNERTAAFHARYQPLQVIGQGGMGEITLAVDNVLGRKVALKSVRGSACDARMIERLRREARTLSRLDHPAICRILDVVERDGAVTLVLPFHPGVSLSEWIDRARARQPHPAFMTLDVSDDGADPMRSLAALIGYFVHVVDAVHAAHASGVIHRDLKPANLLVMPNGMPMVLDFGLAIDLHAASSRLTMAGENIGTSYYMSPEQIEGRGASIHGDVYALGLTLYEMLTLERPFVGETRAATLRQVLGGAIAAPRQRNAMIPPALEAIVLRACARDPDRRFASARELADQLRGVLRALRPSLQLGDVASLDRSVLVGVAALLISVCIAVALAFETAAERSAQRSAEVAALHAQVQLQVDRVERDLLTARQVVADPLPRVDEPRGITLEPPSAVRLNGGSPGTRWQLILRGPDLTAPVTLPWTAGSVAVELPHIPWQPGATYRIYLAPLVADHVGDRAAESATQPVLCSEFLFAPSEVPAITATAALSKAIELVDSGSPCSALMLLDGLRPELFADHRLALLWSALRVRSLVGAGYTRAPLEHAAKEMAETLRIARVARAREILSVLATAEPGSCLALEQVAELEAAVPMSSPPGPWAQMAIARVQLDGEGRPSAALTRLDQVIAALRMSREWDEVDRRLLVENAGLFAITQPARKLAGSVADALAHAHVLRARALVQLGRGKEAAECLSQADVEISRVEAVVLRALALIQSAEARVILGDRLWDEPLQAAEKLCLEQSQLLPDPMWASCRAGAAGVAARLHMVCGQYDLAERSYRQLLARCNQASDAAAAWAGIGPGAAPIVALRLATCICWTSAARIQEAQGLMVSMARPGSPAGCITPALASRRFLVRALVRWRLGLDTASRESLVRDLQAILEDPLMREASMELEEIRDARQRIAAGEKI